MPEHNNFDHLPDAPGAVDIQQLLGESAEELAGNEPAEHQSTTESTEQSTTQTWELDGEQIPIEQAREWLSKGRDATKKWQEAADLKREADAQLQRVHWADELEKIWTSGPEGQRLVIEGLQKQAGYQPSTNFQHQQLNEDELSDEGRVLWQQNAALKQELAQTRQQMAKALESLEQYVGEQRTTDQAAQTAARLKSEWGVDVQPNQLREAARRTGIQDLEAAWLKENKALLRQPTAEQKPNTPGTSDKTFDPDAKDMTADKMFKLLLQGYQPRT